MAKEKDAVALPSNEQLALIEKTAAKYTIAELDKFGRFERAVRLAEGMLALREMVRPIIPRIMPLQGSNLGFKTDKQYSEDIICEAVIEATLRGVLPVGNEFNVISGRCYITKEGYTRLVRDLPGMADLEMVPGVPKAQEGGAVVPFSATWTIDGKRKSLKRDIPVRLNSGMGADGAIGKATRKMLASIYAMMTGSSVDDSDPEPPEETPKVVVTGTTTENNGFENPPDAVGQASVAMLRTELNVSLKEIAAVEGKPLEEVTRQFNGAMGVDSIDQLTSERLKIGIEKANTRLQRLKQAKKDAEAAETAKQQQNQPPPDREPGSDDDDIGDADGELPPEHGSLNRLPDMICQTIEKEIKAASTTWEIVRRELDLIQLYPHELTLELAESVRDFLAKKATGKKK